MQHFLFKNIEGYASYIGLLSEQCI